MNLPSFYLTKFNLSLPAFHARMTKKDKKNIYKPNAVMMIHKKIKFYRYNQKICYKKYLINSKNFKLNLVFDSFGTGNKIIKDLLFF